MFTFGSPLYFLLAIPAVAAAFWAYRARARAGIVFARAHQCLQTRPSWRVRVAALMPAFSVLGLLFVVVALARPRTVFSRIRRTVDAIAIVMTVDVSGSMEALDLSDIDGDRITRQRTRLDAVKNTFAEFVDQRPDDLIGLVTFGGFASTRCPLTSDHDALLHTLSGVAIPKPSADMDGDTLSQEELMTAIGDGLATACARIRDAEPKSKIVVLLSDGESNTGIIEPESAMRIAKELGIRVYTIGVGTTGRAPFGARDVFGNDVIRWGEVALDEGLLRKIADTTGGRYFNVRDPEGLTHAMTDINKLERTRVDREIYEQFNELFGWFLIPGLACVALGTGLNMMITRRLL